MWFTAYCVIAICFMLYYASQHSFVEQLAPRANMTTKQAKIMLNVLIVSSILWPLLIIILLMGRHYDNADISRRP